MSLPPRIAANQQRTLLALLAQLLPQVGRDSALPRRIKFLLGGNRALGSRDRRLYRELIYTTLRYLPWIQPLLADSPEHGAAAVAWLAPDLKDTIAYRAAHLDGWPAVPASLADKSAVLAARFAPHTFEPAALLPAWFREHCPEAYAAPHLDALLARAPLWIRLQVSDAALVLDEFSRRGWPVRRSHEFPSACALPPDAQVADSDAYRRGFCEIQDLGSQLVLAHAPVAPGQVWLDACAGAGGKSLQLAHAVGECGRVDATDLRAALLDELRERAARARLRNIRPLSGAPEVSYDGVLVDAPCSGTGTWRRLPHMKWFTQPDMLREFAATQLAILRDHADLVRPGGVLVYATCSLSRVENRDVASSFLTARPDYSAERPERECGGHFDGFGTTLLPGTWDSDGFYVAVLRRRFAS